MSCTGTSPCREPRLLRVVGPNVCRPAGRHPCPAQPVRRRQTSAPHLSVARAPPAPIRRASSRGPLCRRNMPCDGTICIDADCDFPLANLPYGVFRLIGSSLVAALDQVSSGSWSDSWIRHDSLR